MVHTDALGDWHAEMDAGCSGYLGAHGGYLVAIALRAPEPARELAVWMRLHFAAAGNLQTVGMSNEWRVADLDGVSESDWVPVVLRNRFAADGYASEDGEHRSRDGRALLQSRQLRRVLV
jgi:hypothetical protein